jgi:bacteriocin biosynthesis cyclodehydratase domain-containing protein
VNIHVVHSGPFGASVASSVGRRFPALLHVDAHDADAVCALLHWPDVALLDALDALSARAGKAFLPVVVAGATLVAGPRRSAHGGACFRCAERRRRAHAPTLEREDAARAHLENHRELGYVGIPGAVLGIAEALVEDWILNPARAVGMVTTVDILRCEVATHRVAGVHGCERCRPARCIDDAAVRLEAILDEVLS